MTIKDAFKRYHSIETELLLSHVLGQPKEFLYTHPEYVLTQVEQNQLIKFVARRLKSEPVAYIVGLKDFYGLRFRVNKNVLIPRPETEWLVEQVVTRAKGLGLRAKGTIKILDMGTGSGCIIISIAKQLKNFQFSIFNFQLTATDISPKALSVARANAGTHKATVHFIESNLFTNIHGKFDIIVANLPYVSAEDYKTFFYNLKYEPKIAITEGSNAWKLYERFFKQAVKHITPGGTILMEFDPQTKPFATAWIKQYLPGAKVKFYKDLHNLWRFVEITIRPQFGRVISLAFRR